jgi:3-deoxy-7-phosphoheptulonate synthase
MEEGTMILVLEEKVSAEEKSRLKSILFREGCIVRDLSDGGQNVIAAVCRANPGRDFFEGLPGVARAVPIATAFKLVNRQMRPEGSQVSIGPVRVGGERIVVVAGPCAVESREQALTIAARVKRCGAVLFRGGAFKPRSSPYSFQGLGEEGLRILAEVRDTHGLAVVTEMTSPLQADLMMKYVDGVQVGARNMQNFELLKCVGRMGKPVILKRGLSSTMEEWLMSAEYILAEGNDRVVLCERGIRTFEPWTRNTLDLSAIPVLKQLTHLPVVIDPSHATGIREKVSPMARAAIAAGADGLMIEVHHDPDRALSDGAQSLYPEQFGQLMRDIYVIAPVVGKQVDFSYLEKRAAPPAAAGAARSGPPRAALLGGAGTYSHNACGQFFGDGVAPHACPTFRAIFEAVAGGAADYGVVPLENSQTGSIHENYDLLLDFDLRIVGEITLRIIHHLIAPPGAALEGIARVLGAPQALQQCRQFLERHPDWEALPAADTLSAVRQAQEDPAGRSAAIGSREAAAQRGMALLAEGIESDPRNYTRFVIVARQPLAGGARRKSSLVFAVGNQPGALHRLLQIFAEQGVNLVKLESRPILGKPWEYMFYADLEADAEAPAFAPVLARLGEASDFVKLLGSY